MPNPIDGLKGYAENAPNTLEMLTRTGRAGPVQEGQPQDEEGFLSGLLHMLQGPAHPESAGDMAGLMIPGLTGAASGALGALKGLAGRMGLGRAAEVAPAASQALEPALQGASSGADMLHPGAQAMMESMHKSASPVFQGLKQAGAFAGDRTVGNLIPSGLGNIPQPLSQVASEFVPMGEEAAYNASKAVAPLTSATKMTPAEMGFQRIMANRGR